VAAQKGKLWFGKRDSQDLEARERFGDQVEQALAGGLTEWMQRPEGWLALVLLLDQIPRMIFRETPKAFSGDSRAQKLVAQGIAADFDRQLQPIQRVFIYLVFEQSELQLSGQIVQQLKLTVDERGGGLGDQAPALKFAVRATQLVFLARGPGPYTLAVGNSTAKAVNLPLSTLIPDYSPAKLATLGRATVDVGAVVSSASTEKTLATTDTQWKKFGLWVVLLLSVLFLAAMAFSLLRKPPVKP